MLDLADYDFSLPAEAIAQQPPQRRDASRLLIVDRESGRRTHAHVFDLPELLRQGDVVVGNATRVRRARLRGKKESGGGAEALLLGPDESRPGLRALVRCRGRLRAGQRFLFAADGAELEAEILALLESGEVILQFPAGSDPYSLGEMPLPPYIVREAPETTDTARYQTVFAREAGSVAAPTAGLHLTREAIARIEAAGARWAEIVLHIGVGTFRPIRPEDLAAGQLHPEPFEIPATTASEVARTRTAGGRVIAVGTTVTRTLEHAARPGGLVATGSGTTRLLITPGHRFQVVDGLLTNFHLPRSSLLLLVCAFASRELILDAYAEAISKGYRFYSYGDAMLIQ